MALSGCTGEKYALNFNDADFESKRTAYAAGEKVTVYYDLIATDTDYWFYTDSEDVELKRDFDNEHGYVFTFIMPAHDVTLDVESRNSMEPEFPEPEPEEIQETDSPSEPEDEIPGEPWFCPECGLRNTGNKCKDCGLKRPVAEEESVISRLRIKPQGVLLGILNDEEERPQKEESNGVL